MTPGYVTVYQISGGFPDWQFACIGFLPLLAAIFITWGKRRFRWSQPHLLMPIFMFLFGILWIGAAGISTYTEDSRAFNAFQRGQYLVVEGIVTDFHPMPYEGHQDECFTVHAHRFCYSDYEIVPGFHNSASHGGPIREGLPIRIAYTDSAILRLEVAQQQAITPAQSAAIAAASEKDFQQRSENDPVQQEVITAFLFVATAWTLWWNLQWRRVMRFWLRPPYRPATQYGFRIFFAANLIGAILQTIQQLHHHPLTGANIRAILEITALMGVIVGGMSNLSLRMVERRDRKAAEKEAPVQ